jgi:voltage-gated potassium channel
MTQRGHRASNTLRSVAMLACVLLIYYGVPLGWEAGRVSDVVGVIVFVVGLGGVVLLIRLQVRRYVRASGQRGQITAILSVLYVVVMFFALFYYVLELNMPGQFDGLETRTDSMYFTVITLGTVGYGDIHAVGQVARAATTVQVVFDLIVIGTLLAVAAPGVAHRIVHNATDDHEKRRGS